MKIRIPEIPKEDSSNKHEVTLGTLYEMNKQAILSQPFLKQSEIDNIKSQLKEWFNQTLNEYIMLLCRERYDFTVIHLNEKQNSNSSKIATNELIDILKNRGKILSIEKDNTTIDNNAWEIWIKIGKEAFAYYLFGCDDWVIKC